LRVAITGGTGFVGKHLIARHVACGDQVHYLTRKKEFGFNCGAIAYSGSLNSPMTELRRFLQGADVLYHCAAELRDEAEMESTNVVGTANLLAAATGEVGRWVQLSSTGVYGSNRNNDIDEYSELDPVNAYEKSKVDSDMLVCATADEEKLPCVLLRPSNIYGTDMPNQSIFHLISMVDKGLFFFIGKRGALATYVHVENVVDALVLCGTVGLDVNCRAYIVSDHRTLDDFIGIIASALDVRTPQKRLPESLVRAAAALLGSIPKFPLKQSRIDALTNRTVYQTDRIESELGYSINISMEEGIGELARHWKNAST